MRNRIIRGISITLVIMLMLTMLNPTHIIATEIQPRIINFHNEDETTITIADNGRRSIKAIDKVPLFNQKDYPDVQYGKHGSIASHGCGIVCLAMVVTYLKDEFHSPVDLAKQFGNYNTASGSYWSLFKDSAEPLGVVVEEQTRSWKKVKAALQNGQVVICIQREGLFTDGGHFIVLTGLTEDGKILVNDPSGNNWTKNEELIDGFANGFTEEQITNASGCYWIYAPK